MYEQHFRGEGDQEQLCDYTFFCDTVSTLYKILMDQIKIYAWLQNLLQLMNDEHNCLLITYSKHQY